MSPNKRFLTALTALLLAVATAMAASISIKIIPLGGNRINVNDKFQVVVNLNGISDVPDIDIPGATIMGTSVNQIASVSGERPVTKTEVTLLCRAKEPGNYSLGPIKVGKVRSNKVSYTIGGNATTASSKPVDREMFLRASISKSTAYECEAIVYTVKLYSNYASIKNISTHAKPEFTGFTVKDITPADEVFQVERIDGKEYLTAVISRYIMEPYDSGEFILIGNPYIIEVDENDYSGNYFDLNGTGKSDGENTTTELNLNPNDLSVNVLPLPEPQPDDFSGGVGDFTISSELDGKAFRTGEAYDITYTISGPGNLAYAVLPTPGFNLPQGIDIKSHVIDSNELVSGDTVTGTMKITYTFVPSEPGDFEIADFKFVYFNPATAQYETTVAKGYKIHVEKGIETDKAQHTVSAPVPQNPEPVASGKTIKATTI